MSDEAKFGEDAWHAAIDALTLQLKTLHELRNSVDPGYRAGRPHDPNAEALAKKSQDFLFGLARLQLDHFRHVLEFGNSHFDNVVEQLQKLGRLGTALLGEPPRAEVTMRGPLRGTATVTFTVHNIRARPATMRFVTTEFIAEEDSRHITVPVVVEATGTKFASVLDAYADAEFRVRLTLDPRAFRPGRYRAKTYAMDGDLVAGVVDLTVEVAAESAGRARRKKGVSRRTRRRRGA
jgi:hypothetical protein